MFSLRQTATYWAPGVLDEYASPSFSAPVTLNSRWENITKIVTNAEGEQSVTLDTCVFLESDVEEGGYLFLGNSIAVDPLTQPEAKRITQFSRIPGIDPDKVLRKAMI